MAERRIVCSLTLSRMCFVCGIDNPVGLHLAFYTDEEGRFGARFRPRPEHRGYPGHLHGGIIMAQPAGSAPASCRAGPRLPDQWLSNAGSILSCKPDDQIRMIGEIPQ